MSTIIHLSFSPKGDKTLWADRPPSRVVDHLSNGAELDLAVLESGMKSGAPSIMMRIPITSPTLRELIGGVREPVVMVEMSVGAFLMAAGFARGHAERLGFKDIG